MSKKKNPHMVEIDARVLAAANAEKEPEVELRKELITDPGIADLSDAVKAHYDPALDYVELEANGHRFKVLKVDLWQFVFSTCSAHVRDQLMPVRQTEVMHYHKVHTVRLMKDMRAGDNMRVRCEIAVPLTVVEGLKGMVEKEKGSGIILPH